MKVRRFILENEKGQQFRLDNLDEGCFLTSPSGLGYSYDVKFIQLKHIFIENYKANEQKNPKGILYFKSYDKVKEFCDFVEMSEKLKLVYIVPSKENDKVYYRDINIKKIEKTEKTGKWLACQVEFFGISLWYEENTITYTIEPLTDELRWDFTWDSAFNDNSSQSINYQNRGHIEAPILLEVEGAVSNVIIDIYIDNELVQDVKFKTNILKYEKLIYNSKENEFSIKKIKADGTEENLFDLDVIDFENNNVIRIPRNKTCEIRLRADSTIENAKLIIYPQYLCV